MNQTANSTKWGMKSSVFNSLISTVIGSAVGYYMGRKAAQGLHSNRSESGHFDEQQE